MNFKPIYCYYGNTKFSSEEIDELKSNIDKIDSEKYSLQFLEFINHP